MSKQVKLRRGTTSEHATFTGAVGEVTVDTTKDVAVVHDGVTAGGVPMAREDRPRGWVRTEVFATVGAATWTQTGKTDLKRIRVTCYGGGGGGGSSANSSGGGAGGIGIVTLEASSVTTNVTVTVGAAGAAGSAGGTSSFGAYISSTGGGSGVNTSPADQGTWQTGGAGGNSTGTGVSVLGGQGGASGWGFTASPAVSFPQYPGTDYNSARGGGMGGGSGSYNAAGTAAKGITGSGGGGGQAGAQGSVIVEEIYGLY